MDGSVALDLRQTVHRRERRGCAGPPEYWGGATQMNALRAKHPIRQIGTHGARVCPGASAFSAVNSLAEPTRGMAPEISLRRRPPRRSVLLDRHPPMNPVFLRRIIPRRLVHRAPVVPDHDIAHPPLMPIFRLRLDHGSRQFLEQRLVRHVGTVSYGIYLLNVPVVTAARRVLGPAVAAPLLFIAALSGSIALATLTYRFVERPLVSLRERFRA